MAANIIGLGLIVAGVIFMIMGGVLLWIIGVICLIGGVGALFMTWQRKRRATAYCSSNSPRLPAHSAKT